MSRREDDENIKKKTRSISFSELAGDAIGYKPNFSRPHKEISYDDPYFRMLDAGHDLLLSKKRGKEIVEHLPKDLQNILMELEGIIKEMTMAAMADDFDYELQLNRVYFNMMRVDRLSSVLSYKMKRFAKNQKDVEAYFGADGKRSMHSFMNEITKLVSITEELSLSSNLFMNYMEETYSLDQEFLNKRALAHEKTLNMTNPG